MKQHLLQLDRVRGGTRHDFSEGMFLDRNERVIPYNQDITQQLLQRLSKVPLNLYPELGPFYRKLSDWIGTDESQIYVTEGVSGSIKALIEAIAEKGNNIVFPTPSFALYPVYCRMFDLECRTVGYTSNYQLDTEALYHNIDKDTALVFIPNPNMPIEGTLDLEQIASLAEYCQKMDACLVIDEVYYPFGGPTARSLIGKHENMFVMRSFSKAFGLAGVRVGYLLGTEKNIAYVSKVRLGYENNAVSLEIASFFIDNIHIIESYINQVKEGFVYLKEKLNEMGLEHNGGNTGNFLYVNLHDVNLTNQIIEELKKKKIYVRGGWPPPFSQGFSVTGAPLEIVKQFCGEFSRIYSKLK